DPDKLYCICQRPYSKRFMICCDKCTEWYHGFCMGITKNQGKKMAVNQHVWVCPVCRGQSML
ncbi:hypothetical protein CAPTEDRAFT_141183, partial [Capitella teleta]